MADYCVFDRDEQCCHEDCPFNCSRKSMWSDSEEYDPDYLHDCMREEEYE